MNLCLVIDRSGSMEGQPLEYVKQACCHVVDLLSPSDVLSIVTFEEMVEVLMPPQAVSNKDLVKSGISRLQAGNTTNLYDGISLAMQQVMQFIESNRATRMIVLTDGDPTAGIKDYTALVNHSAELRNKGISVTFLGFGPDYNEELLAGMAKKAGGNYYFIPQPQMIPEIFRSELEKLMTTVTRNMSLELKLARWVQMRGPQQVMEGTLTIPLADMERGSVIQQVIDLEFTNHPLGHYRVLGGKLTYEDLMAGQTKTLELDFEMEFTSDTARYSSPVNPRVGQAAQIVASSKAIEKTVMGLKTGMITQMGAISELQKTQALLLADGRTAEAQEVTMALRALQSGDKGAAEKTLMGTFVNLDTGKSSH
jgi:Ca-activated chloride channel homolog